MAGVIVTLRLCATGLLREPSPPPGWVLLSTLNATHTGPVASQVPRGHLAFQISTGGSAPGTSTRGGHGPQCSAAAGGKHTEQRAEGGQEQWRECGWCALLRDLLAKVRARVCVVK